MELAEDGPVGKVIGLFLSVAVQRARCAYRLQRGRSHAAAHKMRVSKGRTNRRLKQKRQDRRHDSGGGGQGTDGTEVKTGGHPPDGHTKGGTLSW